MKKPISFLLALSFISSLVWAGLEYRKVRWWMLQDVTFESVFDEEIEGYKQVPTFGERVLSLDGKKIEISGYVIPVDISAGEYVLSAYPFSSCYFCGGAGPESVMELNISSKSKKFKTDDYITFHGRFRLNKDDMLHLNYLLDEAEVFKTSSD